MNDIKLGISKSRGYENVDLEALRNEKTPQDVQNQEELIKLCLPIIEFLRKQQHPYHTILIKEEGIKLLETKIRIPV